MRTPAWTLGAVLLLLLVGAEPAAAQSRVLGSPLTASPNVRWGCATGFAPPDVQGRFRQVRSGQPDCTWRQTGVFGVSDYSDPRTSSVPASGTITDVAVRSGPNPGLIRFVIMRQLAQPGTGSYCCYFVAETVPVRPRPSSITSFTTDLPVERNVDRQGVLGYDLIGVSGVSGTGSLPLHSTGRHNAFQFTEPGSVNAGAMYPRLGRLGNDSLGGRVEAGLPGWEVLLRWTWCPLGQGRCAAAAAIARRDGLRSDGRLCGSPVGQAFAGLRGPAGIFGDQCGRP